MRFTALCRRVAELARAAGVEWERLRREAGFGDELAVIKVGDPRWAAILAAERPMEDVRRTFILSLSLEDIAKIEAVMYVGRGDSDDYHAMYRHLLGMFDSAVEVAGNMLDKVPFAEYLEAGLRKAEEQGLDLDGSLWLAGSPELSVEN